MKSNILERFLAGFLGVVGADALADWTFGIVAARERLFGFLEGDWLAGDSEEWLGVRDRYVTLTLGVLTGLGEGVRVRVRVRVGVRGGETVLLTTERQ